MSNALDITDATFKSEVLDAKGVTVVDFWATWCGPCRKLGPVLEEVAQELADKIRLVKLNTDENLQVAQDYAISGLPTVMIFKDGEPVERLVGMMQKSAIVANIEKHI